MDDMYPRGLKTTYSRDEAVSAITSYYEWLVEFYLPASVLKYPPEGGWPGLTNEYLTFMNKTDTVLDLLRHLPYIKWEGRQDPYQIYEKTSAVDYTGSFFHDFGGDKGDKTSGDPYPEETALPSHVATIARTSGGRDGYYFFLDTERGTITRCDFQDGPDWGTGLEEDIPEDSEEKWREHQTYKIKDFFEILKDEFRSLDVIPFSATEVEMTKRLGGYNIDKVKQVFQTYGWPSKDYKKDECMKAEEEITEEILG